MPNKQAALRGLVAGVAGVAAMTAAEKLEQQFTHRPNSYVPAHTLARLVRRKLKPDEQHRGLNWTMHWGQGILLGPNLSLLSQPLRAALRSAIATSSSCSVLVGARRPSPCLFVIVAQTSGAFAHPH